MCSLRSMLQGIHWTSWPHVYVTGYNVGVLLYLVHEHKAIRHGEMLTGAVIFLSEIDKMPTIYEAMNSPRF